MVYIPTSVQLRRFASVNQSPVYSHFSETLTGASVIRAHGAQERFLRESEERIDEFTKGVYGIDCAAKWLMCRLDFLSHIIVLTTCVLAVTLRSDLSPGLTGLTITYMLRVTKNFSTVTRLSGEYETAVVSVERIMEYSGLESEAPWTMPTDSDEKNRWSEDGSVQFVNYSTRYREDLDCVLKNITCKIHGGEKVGIVGRTGAGKSSLSLALFRLLEAAAGTILIDGQDISGIGLHRLRRHVTLLTQEPILFAGTLRRNLDPFRENDDSDVWSALDHAHLKSFIEGLPKLLDYDVGEGGANLSMGQRQLVCLARTLLRKTKLLILDEATASVDLATDELLQETIRTELRGCTVLTIAHRINTVMDYDRILVLHQGEIAEFAPPAELLKDSRSMFYCMAKEAGLVK
ncbi:multidrug resistance-associated protein 1 [Aplysia californica]|uniref:Multidrug resistance-associated protein 1 n=1 Tax=Aplysia californica TaxID=6500 RepID=A0ABM1A4R4_APLCA|nr:multidrug resistance-associated protein 1 [Aplysia californica]